MATMVEYLSGRREPFPDWLDELNEKDCNLRHFFRGRTVFYPGAGKDGHPLAIFNPSHSAHCYFFVDQRYSNENLEEEIGNSPTGYSIVFCKQYSTGDLRRESPYPLPDEHLRQFSTRPRENADCTARSYRSRGNAMFAAVDSTSAVRLRVYNRNPEYDETHGARRIALFYVGMEARTAYEWFYGTMFRDNPPFAILLQDNGFGGDFARDTADDSGFGDPDGRLCQAALDNGLPKFLIVADNTKKWPEYGAVPGVFSDRGGASAGFDRCLYKLTGDSPLR